MWNATKDNISHMKRRHLQCFDQNDAEVSRQTETKQKTNVEDLLQYADSLKK